MGGLRISRAVARTEAPPIPRAQAWADQYTQTTSSDSDAPPILNSAQGVPKDPPHPILLSALAQYASDPKSAGYGTILGEPLLREALAKEFNLMYRLPTATATATDQDGIGMMEGNGIKKSEISITTGCNMAFLVLVMVLCPPGSKALMPLPAYFSQSMSLSLQSVEPIYIPCLPSSGFKPSLPAARRYLETDKERGIRMIVLVTPSNPTGAIYTPQELEEWYDLAKEFGVALVLDETYRDFVDARPESEREAPHDLFKVEGWQDTLISIGSMSKGYRIPGHRLGTITASAALQESIAVVCDCMQICAPKPPQLALASVLPQLRHDLSASSLALSNRLSLFSQIIDNLPGWSVVSKGGYYAYVQFPESYLSQQSVLRLNEDEKVGSGVVARYLAERLGVICLPGSFFMPDLQDREVWDGIEEVGGGELKADRWLRFAIANVDDEVVISLEPRLQRLNELLGMS